VQEAALSPLAAWEAFYVIVGSSAAALTGLQFVVIALVAESRRKTTFREINAFGTPTVVHFGAVLLVSAILSAPWQRLANTGLALGTCGAAGIVYGFIVVRRARRQTEYQPDAEDWVWYVGLPFVAYTALLVAAIVLRRHPAPCLFAVGGAAVLLLFIGIRNAWDTVTYLAIGQWRGAAPPEDR